METAGPAMETAKRTMKCRDKMLSDTRPADPFSRRPQPPTTTRAGKLAKEQARLKAERRAASMEEAAVTAPSNVTTTEAVSEQNAAASSSATTLEAVAPSTSYTEAGMSWDEYTTGAYESFTPPMQEQPSPPPAPEQGPPGAAEPWNPSTYEEEEVALRWDNEDEEEERPFAGPF
ncbi:hypothetical protein C8R47DRAFT_1068444 [Mycena vitilis]|nr:hypothetical protein C8R47DRAFT_1068444 [Mycena vitilis]